MKHLNEDEEDKIIDAQNNSMIRVSEAIVVLIAILMLITVIMGIDARSLAIKSASNIERSANAVYLYYTMGVFPLIYLYIEDRRLADEQKASWLWYGLMVSSTLVIWSIIGWVSGFNYMP